MVVDTANCHDVTSEQAAVRTSDRATSGICASDTVCWVCTDAKPVVRGRCRRCYMWWRRHGGEDEIDVQDRAARATKKRKPVVVRRLEPEDDGTLTYDEWRKANGYDHTTRTYAP